MAIKSEHEQVEVKFNPRYKGFSAFFKTSTAVAYIMIIVLLFCYITEHNQVYGNICTTVMSFVLVGFLGFVLYGAFRPLAKVESKTNSVTFIGLPQEALTESILSSAMAKFLGLGSREMLRLPEPDAKFDAERNKKIPFASPEEKKAILDEQIKVAEEVEVTVIGEVKKIALESPTSE